MFAAQMKPFQFKALHYEKDVESFTLGFETQNQAPFDALTSVKSVIWRLNTYSGDWRVPARQYQDWMERKHSSDWLGDWMRCQHGLKKLVWLLSITV